jgi:hypothetical protein
MPVAAARKIEFFARERDEPLDIQLHPILLTHEQCIEFELPRTPIKESEIRAGNFEARFGEGATELDAMEALHPGELRRILAEEIERFHNPDFEAEWDAACEDAQSAIDDVEDEVLERCAEETAALEQRCADLKALADEQAADMRRQVDERLADLRRLADERFGALARQGEQVAADVNAHIAEIEQDLVDAAPDADEFNWPEPPDGWEDPLLDTTRGYVEQVDRYKEHQGKRVIRKAPTAPVVCALCGTAFEAKGFTAMYCSPVCRLRAHRAKDKARAVKHT